LSAAATSSAKAETHVSEPAVPRSRVLRIQEPSIDQKTSAHDYRFAGNVRRIVRCQKHRRRTDLGRFAATAERNLSDVITRKSAFSFFVHHVLARFSSDVARSNGIYPYIVRSEFERHRFSKPKQCRFCRAIN